MAVHKPRKDNDVNRIRCILLNVNEGLESFSDDYNCSEERFRALLEALVSEGIISKMNDKGKLSTSQYIIANIQQYEEWKRSAFYRAIDKFVIPLIQLSTEVLKYIPPR